jgi:vacuolar protein sorting-associated protein 13A/C
MRIIDIAIPQSSGQVENQHPHRPSLPNPNKPGFRSQHTVQEYILDDDDSTLVDFGGEGDMESVEPDKFYDASDATTEAQREGLHQKTFEFNFLVGELQASLSRSTSNGIEKALAAARLSGFNLDFALRKYDMSVDLGLKQLDLEMLDGSHRQPVIDSGDSQVDDLVKVNYRKVQKESPEYMSVFDGADQSIAVDLSTFRIHAQPEPLLALYDFIMTTFVPNTPPASELAVGAASSGNQDVVQGEDSSDKIRIRVKLRSIERK